MVETYGTFIDFFIFIYFLYINDRRWVDVILTTVRTTPSFLCISVASGREETGNPICPSVQATIPVAVLLVFESMDCLSQMTKGI